MKIVICGMSGFVGSALREYLLQRSDTVVGLSIRADTSVEKIVKTIENADVVINLSGANILGRWSESYKNILRQSRLESTDKLAAAIVACSNPPSTFINASAVGIYDGDHQHTEASEAFANDFLATLVMDWEKAAMAAKKTRVCVMRFGVVLGKDGGAMQKILPPFKMGLGGKMGDGTQMVSWIHLDDLVRACAFLIDHANLNGVVNFTAPLPLSNASQTKIIGKVLHRPTFFTLPAWLVKLAFGEGSSVMLDSKEVYPEKLLKNGFEFLHPSFEEALRQIVLRD
ncbi:MAG: TIGR01777 family oxidoreductase [Sulfuricurvum sp.]|nr:TIGR01777 family oxidoreductase [Sulfuricurvum sp.]